MIATRVLARCSTVPSAGRLVWIGTIAAGACCAGCRDTSPGPPPVSGKVATTTRIRFQDRSPGAGVDFTYRTGAASHRAAIVESLGGGCAILDVDRDGDLDLVFPGGGSFDAAGRPVAGPHGLFLQIEPWKYADATKAGGLDESRHYTHGVAVADVDADGFPDLLFTGYGGLQLYLNQGDGTFADQTEPAGLSDLLWSTSAAWGDLNQDGHLDLYVCHYVDWSVDNDPACLGNKPGIPEVCQPRQFKGLPDTLYLSAGDGTFRDASRESGLKDDGKGLGVLLADFDGDGRLDIFVANDTVANFLYRNDGLSDAGSLRLQEIGVESGAAFNEMGTPNSGMGVAVLDFNTDGRPDIWVSTYEFESPALYRNEGHLSFLHVSHSARIAGGAGSFVGFGTVAADFDGDGDEDVLIANGHVLRNPASGPPPQPCLLYENLGNGSFKNVTAGAGRCLLEPHLGRGLARGDLDGDGDLDVVLSSSDEVVRLFENATPGVRAVRVRLIGRRSPRDGEGAAIKLKFAGGERLFLACPGESYLSSSLAGVSCGVPPDAESLTLEIRWPSGAKQTLDGLSAGDQVMMIEPD